MGACGGPVALLASRSRLARPLEAYADDGPHFKINPRAGPTFCKSDVTARCDGL
jgi:hypothetical protein